MILFLNIGSGSDKPTRQDLSSILLDLPLCLELEYPHNALPEIAMQNSGRISAQMEV